MGCGTLCSKPVKKKVAPAKVFFAGMIWRSLGARDAADTLLQALSGDDEQNRMLAGMSLVKAGGRSLDVIEKKIAAGEATPSIVRLLPDLGGPRARALLDEIACGEPGELADTARQCLELLDRIDSLGSENGSSSSR